MDNTYLETLYDLAKELNTADDIPGMLDAVVNHLPKVLGAHYCSLFIRNPSSGELEIKAHNHLDIGEDPFIHVGSDQESIMNLVVARNASIIIKDIEEEIGVQNKEKYDTKSFMCILIKHSGEMKGVLNLADKPSGGFTKDDMVIASTISELLGALLARTNINTL